MNVFAQMVEKIIEQQEAIIGPIAIERANLVKELEINWAQHDISITGNEQTTIDELVKRYEELFGPIAVETCKEAVSKLLVQLPADQQPKSLR
jgi:hypothetical protein